MKFIYDLIEMPGTDPEIVGWHGMRSVSEGLVTWHHTNKATCHKHGAMNCVSPDRQIWRCLAEGCKVAGYTPQPWGGPSPVRP